MQQLRTSILSQHQLLSSKPRFALFSQPPPLAIGDNSLYPKTQRTDGKPVTDPPQMLAGLCRSGMTKSAFFGAESSVYQGDRYVQRFRVDREYERKYHTRSDMHQNQFGPASSGRILHKSAYKYISQNPENIQQQKKTIIRDQTGKVKTGQKNFTTNSIRKVQSQFFKPYKYMQDPIQRKKQMQKRQRQLFKSKLPQMNFNPTSHGQKLFTKDSQIYGQDAKAKKILAGKKRQSKSVISLYQHQSPFIPARKGHGDPIGKYPQTIQPKTSQISSPNKIKKQQSKQKWVPNKHQLSRPTPSIMLNPSNLKLRAGK